MNQSIILDNEDYKQISKQIAKGQIAGAFEKYLGDQKYCDVQWQLLIN